MRTQTKERPYVRRRIVKYLAANPHVTLKDLAQGFYLDASGVPRYFYYTSGERTQARKMLQEEASAESQGAAQTSDEQQSSAGRFDFERMLKTHNEQINKSKQTKNPVPIKPYNQELVYNDGFGTVMRMAVPEGSVYITFDTNSIPRAMCFVPPPAESAKGKVDNG